MKREKQVKAGGASEVKAGETSEVKPESSSEVKSTRRKTVVKKIVTVFLTILVIMCVSEVLLHIACRLTKGIWYPELRRREFPPLYNSDPALRWRLMPDMNIRFTTREFDTHIVTDGEGFRKESSDFDGKPHAVVIGDSFSFGWGVEPKDTFSAILSGSHHIPAHSKGVPGFGLEQEELLLKEVLRKETATLIILQTWPLDWDVLNSDRMEVAEHYLVSRDVVRNSPQWMVHMRIALMEYSPLYGMANRFGTLIHHIFHRNELLGGFGLDVFSDGRQCDMVVQARSRAFSAIKRMRDLADSKGVSFVVVTVPSVFQVYPDRQKSWERIYGISGRLDPDRPDRELKQFAESEGIYLLDLLPYFREKAGAGQRQLYFDIDPHWNAEGHKIAAEAIAGFLRKNGLSK
ncbi:MAG: hypothetical protein AB9903_05930 [Vulcanimicrobiota bacterium]